MKTAYSNEVVSRASPYLCHCAIAKAIAQYSNGEGSSLAGSDPFGNTGKGLAPRDYEGRGWRETSNDHEDWRSQHCGPPAR